MDKTYYTIYKVTNKINGKFYIGTHKTKNLDDKYMGSGKYLKRAQEKYGLENFTKEILFIFDNPDDMYAKEAEIVNEDFLAEENTYNLKAGGLGGWDYINFNSSHHSYAGKLGFIGQKKLLLEKYGVDHISKLESTRKKLSEFRKGKQFSDWTGKSHSEETKKKIRESIKGKRSGVNNSQYGTMWITNGIENKKIRKDEYIPEGWFRGRKQKVCNSV